MSLFRLCAGTWLAAAACGAVGAAHASLVISSGQTQNVNCSGGICAPTAASAVLNANDLENLLGAGNVEVTTTGTGVQANNIEIKTAISWPSASALSLDAWKSITVDKPVSITGTAALSLTTDDGGKNGVLSFGPKGNVTFASLSSSLTINGATYTLVGDIKSLANAIANNPSGNYALAANYDASVDGKYTSSPVPTTFTGNLQGLGNAFENLTIDDLTEGAIVGFFTMIGPAGNVSNLGLTSLSLIAAKGTRHVQAYVGGFAAYNYGTFSGDFESGALATTNWTYIGGFVADNEGTIDSVRSNAKISSSGVMAGGIAAETFGSITNSYTTGEVSGGQYVGGVVGENGGSLSHSHSTGVITGQNFIGGIAGLNGARITGCFATGSVLGNKPGAVGGLTGLNIEYGYISNSYATGQAIGGNEYSPTGGLVGNNSQGAFIENSYATGSVTTKSNSDAGGFVGYNDGLIEYSYSTGSPSAGTDGFVGGLVGEDLSGSGSLTDDYWDTDLSGITNLSEGAGNIANDPGITGLTTAQLQSELPSGFDPEIWGEDSNINDGLPYLLANPPARKKH